jgi:hypothetical protein
LITITPCPWIIFRGGHIVLSFGFSKTGVNLHVLFQHLMFVDPKANFVPHICALGIQFGVVADGKTEGPPQLSDAIETRWTILS